MRFALALPALLTAALAQAPLIAAEIPQGTHVLLRMLNTVSTRTAEQGNQVYLQTVTPIVVEGRIVVPPNAYVQGMVSVSKRGGRVAGRAELGIHLDTLTLPSGQTLKIAPRLSSADSTENGQKVEKESTIEQGSGKGKDAGRVAITAGTGAAIGGLADRSWKGAGIGAAAGTAVGVATVLLTRGPDVELRQGTTLDIVFDRALTVE